MNRNLLTILNVSEVGPGERDLLQGGFGLQTEFIPTIRLFNRLFVDFACRVTAQVAYFRREKVTRCLFSPKKRQRITFFNGKFGRVVFLIYRVITNRK